jgi:hypothetical protein
VLETAAETRLVVPAGMQAMGGDLEPIGKEPQTGALVYGVKSASFRVAVTGTGNLRAQQEQAANGDSTFAGGGGGGAEPGGDAAGGAAPQGSRAAAAPPAEEDGPRFEEILPPGYDRDMPYALALFALILAVAFAAMYVKGGADSTSGSGRAG